MVHSPRLSHVGVLVEGGKVKNVIEEGLNGCHFEICMVRTSDGIGDSEGGYKAKARAEEKMRVRN